MASSNTRRIAKNTLMLYVRHVLILLVSLYTVRIVLDVLGAEDYGLYNVIAGIVTLLSFLSGSMASATQRYFSYAIGEKSVNNLEKIFIVNLFIYIGIAVFATIILETLGLWYVSNHLSIPSDRVSSAIFLFHITILVFVIGVFSSPFKAIIIAHEDMQIFTYISVAEVLLKLMVVAILIYVPWDKLETYGVLQLSVNFITALFYLGVCFKRYNECQIKKIYWDSMLFREILDFTWWTLFGQLTTVSRNQAITVLLNQYFSPVTVASRAIATNIASNVNMFSRNFNMGLYPPIIKSYAAENKNEMNSLIFNGSKITFFLLWIFALPMILEMDTILSIWLIKPPVESKVFSQLALLESLIISVSLPITTAARAPGRMKTYELTLGSFQIILFIISWIILDLGYSAISVYILAIFVNIGMFMARLFIVSGLIGLNIIKYYKYVIIPIIGIVFISSLFGFLFKQLTPNNIIYSMLTLTVTLTTSTLSMYHLGLNKEWKEKVKASIVYYIKKNIIKTRINSLIYHDKKDG